MPKIPTYDRIDTPSPTYQDVGAAGAGFSDLAQLGGQVSDWAAKRLQQQRDAADLAWLTSSLATTRQEWTGRLLKAQQEAPAGAPEFTQQMMTGYDDYVRGLVDQAPSPEARANFEARAAEYRTALMTDAVVFEGRERGRQTYETFVDVRNRSAATLRLDPTQFTDVLMENLAGIEASPTLSAAQRDELRRGAQQALAGSTAYALIERNPRGARETIFSFGQQGYLDPGDVETLLRAADAEQARQEAEARERAREARAAQLAEFMPRLADERAARARGQTVGLSDAEILATLGEADGKQEIAELRARQEAAIAGTALSLLSDEEQDALIAGKKPEGEGFALEAPLFDAYVTARDRLREQRAADPAGYVFTYSPGLRDAYELAAASDDPKDRQRAIEMSLNLQAGLGLPERDRRILSKDGAKAMVGAIVAAQGEAKADAVQSQAAAYGDRWRQVYRELVDAGLPSEYQVLANLDQPGTRKTVAEVLALPEKDLKPLDSVKARDIAEAVDDKLGELAQTLVIAPNGPSVLATWRETARRLAWRYGQAADAGDAATRAVDELMARWDLVLDDRITARAPAGRGEALTRRALGILDGLTADTLADPGGATPETLALTPAQRRESYLAIVQEEGRWWTTADDDGWMLLDPNGRPVRDFKGRAIVLPFEEGPARFDPRSYIPSSAVAP